MSHGQDRSRQTGAAATLAVDGLRPLGHPSTVARLAVGGVGWLVLVGVLIAEAGQLGRHTGSTGGPAWLPAASIGVCVAWLMGTAVTASALRRRVPVRVTAREVTVGTVRLPRAELDVSADGSPTGVGGRRAGTITLRAPNARVRLGAVGRPYPRRAPGTDVLVPAGFLDEIHGLLTGRADPKARSIPLSDSGGRWIRDMLPLWVAVAAIAGINAALPHGVLLGAGVVADVVVFSAAVVLTAVRAAPPRPVLRRLVVDAAGVRLDNPYTGRQLACEPWSNVTVRRNRWRTPGSRYSLGVTMHAVTLLRNDGSRIIAIGLLEPLRSAVNRPPRIRRPRWIAQPAATPVLVGLTTRRASGTAAPG